MHQSRLVRNVRLGIKNLSLHALRSLLTILGVVLGVASVIAMLSVGEGASRAALERIRKLGSTNIIITSVKPAEDQATGAEQARLSMYGLLYEDERRMREGLHRVRRVVPIKHFPKEGRLGERKMELRVVGTTPDWFVVVDRAVLAGRVFGRREYESRANVCVLTESGARRLLAGAHTLGRSVRMGEGYFEVIGIVQSEQVSGEIQAPDQEIDAYIPLNVSQELYGDYTFQRTSGAEIRERVELHQVLVQAESTEDVEGLAAAVEAMLRPSHKRRDYRVSVPLALLRQAEAEKAMWNLVLGSIAGISLLVGGIGIMNIMLASVTERTREIGIRRAIGAKRRQIVGQFLIETVVLSSVGGLIGTGVGFALPWIITLLSGMPTSVPLWSVTLSLGISVGVGIIFGLYPAVRAANLDPIEALRHE